MSQVNARTLAGETTILADEAVSALDTQLAGSLILPGADDYDATRALWNGMADRKPALIARCLGTADVIASVNFAREQGLLVSVRGGGHNVAGMAMADGALAIDLSQMRGVWVDPANRRARAQTGCKLCDVDRETQLHGLAAVLGFVSQTGAAGLTLGGGFGYLTRMHGWTSDNVKSMDVVTADGRLVRASEAENSDLFWALRGGGGNFGVVTGIEYELFPVGPEIMAGAIAWRGEDAQDVLEMYRTFMTGAPPELTVAAVLRKAPPAPWIDEDVHGKSVVVLAVCHAGSVEQAQADLAALKSFGNPVGDVVVPRPYTVQQSLLDATAPNGRRYYWKSEFMPDLDEGLLPVAVRQGAAIGSPHTVLILFPLGEALGKLPVEHSAVGNRDARWVFNAGASWEDPAEDDAEIAWTRDTWRALRAFSTGGTYVNFLSEDDADDRIAEAYGGNLRRLAEVKAKWDPGNMFRVNKNIQPA